MEIGSKLGVYKVKLVEPKNGEPFYLITAFEKVYNSKNKFCSWETVFYNDVYVFDTSLNIEPADFSLSVNSKDKYSFDNIENKDTSIIRVHDFKFEKHTVWKNGEQVKDDWGKPVLKDVFYIKKLTFGNKQWRTDDGEFKLLQRKFEAQKEKIVEQKRRNLDKDVAYRKIIREIKSEKQALEQKIKKLEEIIEKQKDKVSEAKVSVKEANKKVMVVKRRNTMTHKELEKTQNKLKEKKQEIKEVKKMKKTQMLKKVEEFDNIDFDDM